MNCRKAGGLRPRCFGEASHLKSSSNEGIIYVDMTNFLSAQVFKIRQSVGQKVSYDFLSGCLKIRDPPNFPFEMACFFSFEPNGSLGGAPKFWNTAIFQMNNPSI